MNRLVLVLPYLDRGGTEKHVLVLSKALRDRYKLTVLAPPGPLVQEFADQGIELVHFHSLSSSPLGGSLQFVRVLRGLLRSPSSRVRSVIHVHGSPELLWLSHRAARQVPKIFTSHGFHGRGAEASYRVAARISRRCADRVICVSDSESRRLIASRLLPEKQTLIYNGVEEPRPLPEDERRRWFERWFGGEDKPLLIGTAARLVSAKGISHLVSALGILCRDDSVGPAKLVIFGTGPEEDRLANQAAHLGIGDKVIFAGYDPKVKDIMPLWDVFALPSIEEPFGLVCAEAMAAGLPIAASRAGGIPEVVGDDGAGLLVDPADPQALAQALHLLLTNPVLREKMGRVARLRYEKMFTAQKMVEKTISVYESLFTVSSDTDFQPIESWDRS